MICRKPRTTASRRPAASPGCWWTSPGVQFPWGPGGADGYFTIGQIGSATNPEVTRFRGFDAAGQKVYEKVRVGPLTDKPTENFNRVRAADFTAWPVGGGWPNDRIYPAPPKVASAELLAQLDAKQATTVLVDLDGGKTQRLTLDDFRAAASTS